MLFEIVPIPYNVATAVPPLQYADVAAIKSIVDDAEFLSALYPMHFVLFLSFVEFPKSSEFHI
jgi:hypothetical protein